MHLVIILLAIASAAFLLFVELPALLRRPYVLDEALATKLRCPLCKQGHVEQVDVEKGVTVAGRTFTGTVRAERCVKCGEQLFAGSELEAFEESAAYELATDGPVTGETFRYLRAAGLGMRTSELAGLLDVAPETLARWESGKSPTPRTSWAIVAAMVIECRVGNPRTLARLQALAAERPPLVTVRIERGDESAQ